MRKVILEKFKETIIAVSPITAIVLVLNFAFTPMPTLNLIAFIIGVLLLVVGMAMYNLGSDVGISGIGSHIGTCVTKTQKLGILLFVSFLIGVIVTVAEPSLVILSAQVGEAIPLFVLISTIAVGVGIFLLLSFLRVFLKVKLSVMLLVFYGIIFLFAIFVDQNFVPLAFDSGGVATGPLTVPFIMALGVGVTSKLAGKDDRDSSFGIVALCAMGPVLMVILLGLFYNPDLSSQTSSVVQLTDFDSFKSVLSAFVSAIPVYLGEVGISLLPIVLFFLIFQFLTTKMSVRQLARIGIGLIYTYLGLTLFLTSVNVGFMAAGSYLGQTIASNEKSWLIVPIGMLVGACNVLAEPAVHVLNKQVEEITDGHIKRSTMLTVLPIAIAMAVGISMIRILTGLSIWWVLPIGYAVALTLSFFSPKIFVGIGFDSGGVASGPMTTTFLLPFALGACAALGGNPFTDAFGLVASITMTPVIAMQVFGLVYKAKLKKITILSEDILRQIQREGDEIIDLVTVSLPHPTKPSTKPHRGVHEKTH